MRARRKPQRLRKWVARLGAASAAAALLLLIRVQVAMAAAADAGHTGGAAQLGQTPPALAWISLKDSRGISVWNYELSLDRGGTFNPGKFFWSSITDTAWGLYRACVVIAVWFLDWVISFDWLGIVATPVLRIGDALQSIVDQVGAVPALLTVAALLAVTWMARGRWSTGIWELAMALLIASLATGVFAQPVHLLAGTNGLIMKSQRTGLQLSSLLSDTSATGASGAGGIAGASAPTDEQLRAQMTGRLVDAFIREPAEVINFGRVLDGGKCASAYDAVVKAGPYGSDSDIRDKVGDCNKTLGDYAANPSAAMASGSFVFMPAAAIILVLAVVLAGSVIAAGCYALFQGLRAIILLVLGLLPGGTRGGLFLTFAEAAISLLIIVFTSLFLGAFITVIQEIFLAGGAAGDAPAKIFLIVDIVLVIGVVTYWRQRRRLRENAERIAQWMAQRPGKRREVTATRLPERTHGGLVPAAGRALSVASQVSMIASRRALRRRPGTGTTYNIGSLDARRQNLGLFGVGGPGPGADPVTAHVEPVPSGGHPARPALAGRAGRPQIGAYPSVHGTMTAPPPIEAAASPRRSRLLARMGTVAAGSGPSGPAIAMDAEPSSPVVLGERGARPGPAPARPATRPAPAQHGPAPRRDPSQSSARPRTRPGSVRPTPMNPGSPRLPAAGSSPEWIKVVRDGQVLWLPKPASDNPGNTE